MKEKNDMNGVSGISKEEKKVLIALIAFSIVVAIIFYILFKFSVNYRDEIKVSEKCDHVKPPVMKSAKVKYIKKIDGKVYKVCDQEFKCKKCNKNIKIEILRENIKPRNLGTF